MYSENATKSSEISTVDLTVTTLDKSKVEISQKIMAFSEYMNFTNTIFFFEILKSFFKMSAFAGSYFIIDEL